MTEGWKKAGERLCEEYLQVGSTGRGLSDAKAGTSGTSPN